MSGLGVDKRVFDNINFGKLDLEFIDWIEPTKKESLQDYSSRISKKVTSENPILIGLSFGGIVAVEISKIIKTKKIMTLIYLSVPNLNNTLKAKNYHLFMNFN